MRRLRALSLRAARRVPVPQEREVRAQPHHERVERVYLRLRRIPPERVAEGEIHRSRERTRIGHESPEPPLERRIHEPQRRHGDQIPDEHGERSAQHGEEVHPRRRAERQRQHRKYSPREREQRRARGVRYPENVRRRDEFAAVPEHERRRHRQREYGERYQEDRERDQPVQRLFRQSVCTSFGSKRDYFAPAPEDAP